VAPSRQCSKTRSLSRKRIISTACTWPMRGPNWCSNTARRQHRLSSALPALTTRDQFSEVVRHATAHRRFQITTDGFAPYRSAISNTLHDRLRLRAARQGLPQTAMMERSATAPRKYGSRSHGAARSRKNLHIDCRTQQFIAPHGHLSIHAIDERAQQEMGEYWGHYRVLVRVL